MEIRKDQLNRIRRETIQQLDEIRKLPKSEDRDKIEQELLELRDRIEWEMKEIDRIAGQGNVEKSTDDPD